MSFIEFFKGGISFCDGKYDRNRYPKDVISMTGRSSFSYLGQITASSPDGSERVIDGVVKFISTPAAQRAEAIAVLNKLEVLNCLSGTVSSVVCIGSFAMTLPPAGTMLIGLSGIGLGVSACGLAMCSFVRMGEASACARRWEDIVGEIKDLRARLPQHFISLSRHDSCKLLFTPDEMKNIYVSTFRHIRENHQAAMQPKEREYFIQTFFEKNNILIPSLINDTFQSDEEVYDPSGVDSSRWPKKALCAIAVDTQNLADKYISFQSGREGEQEAVDDLAGAGHLGVMGAGIVASDILRRNEKSSIEGGKSAGQAREDRRSNEKTAGVVGLIGHGAVGVYSAVKRGELARNARDHLLETFGQPLTKIFQRCDEIKRFEKVEKAA